MKYLNYRDVTLVPRYSSLKSRSDADTSVDFLGRKFELPIVPSNMADVINEDIAVYLASNDYFYIMHRWSYGIQNEENAEEVIGFIDKMKEKELFSSVSMGTGPLWERTVQEIADNNLKVDYITIDVAHAHHENVQGIIKIIKFLLPQTKLIVGNVATAEACDYLIKLGADAIKIGIGGGRICTTKNKTGFHVPMFSCCLQCAPVCEKYNIPFIADGGLEEFGDVAKALTAGATMVMAGGIFAECIDSPAQIVNGQKEYRGSTSFAMKGKNNHIEGKTLALTHTVKYSERLEEIKQALQSSISYAGGTNLDCFNLVNYILV